MSKDIESLHYRAYLIACDAETESLYDRTRAAFLVRAAALAELALRGVIADDDGDVKLIGPAGTGDGVLDHVLAEIGSSERNWRSWVRRNHKETLSAVEDQLIARQVLSPGEKKVLGLVPKMSLKVTDIKLLKRLQDRVSTILHSEPGTDVDPADAALAILAVHGRVPGVAGRRGARAHAARIDDLTGRIDEVAHGLAEALRRIRMTMIAAQGGAGGS